jgi:hypothetical protein
MQKLEIGMDLFYEIDRRLELNGEDLWKTEDRQVDTNGNHDAAD